MFSMDKRVQEIDGTQLSPSGDLLTLRYVPLSAAKLWDRNAKLHDIGALATSIALHGFRDPPAYDAALDAFVEGNGRTEALQWMYAQGRDRPRGIGLDTKTDEWCIPVLFGVDAKSRLAAERYGIDHNNLVLAGGDFTAIDMAKNWGPGYLQIVQEMAEAKQLPVSVQAEDVQALVANALEQAQAEEATPPSDGSLLALANVVIGDPVHTVVAGDIWHVGDHLLICADVMTDWPIWAPYLQGDGVLFVPYAGPFAPLTIRAERYRMVLVQPDPYIAGHILDRYAELYGRDGIGKD
jgi:hypothetical protein